MDRLDELNQLRGDIARLLERVDQLIVSALADPVVPLGAAIPV